jgi:putative nucleotidyltransferase with HDIG domain
VANSALLGSRYEITSILHALSVVGVDRLRDIVVTVALKNYMGDADNALLHRCWRHNLATALWCEMLAERCRVDRPMGYTAGILHDIGRIALLMLFPDDYAGFLNGAPAGHQVTLAAERKRYDADHCQVGYHLSVSWNFPRVLGDVIAYHHDEVTPRTPRPRLLVHAACVAASMSGFHPAGPECEWETSRIEALLPSKGSTSRPDYEALMHEVERKLNQTECSLL